MLIEQVVINASPLITLFRANLHPLLPRLFPEVLVPDAVWAEVVNRTHSDPATRGLPKADWALRRAVASRPEVTAWGSAPARQRCCPSRGNPPVTRR